VQTAYGRSWWVWACFASIATPPCVRAECVLCIRKKQMRANLTDGLESEVFYKVAFKSNWFHVSVGLARFAPNLSNTVQNLPFLYFRLKGALFKPSVKYMGRISSLDPWSVLLSFCRAREKEDIPTH